ncbi:MAG: thioredoxin domain-containing protein [Bdellovibrionia bacterium]
MANHLGNESSPYLLQHQHNPVHWYPWGEEALQQARSQNKPICLSIGYSACHWCHVMEAECFMNPAIAELMNQHFINIKVDREERPDLDHIYQNVALAMTQGGGWPLTVFLTPDLKPFYGGTYFPPEDRYGRPGFPRVLMALSQAYQNDPEGVVQNADRLVEFIAQAERVPEAEPQPLPTLEQLKALAQQMLLHIDWEHGGIQGAPKFPHSMALSFLWRLGDLAQLPQAQQAALLSLRKMAQGGIYDQLGGGFHRYSVDASWSVPHFEKMLYDNALLLKTYAEVLLSRYLEESQGQTCEILSDSDRKLFLDLLEQTFLYLEREMLSPEGAFYTAQDADSQGHEGRYFVWTPTDLDELVASAELTPSQARVFRLFYGITDQGNFEHGSTVLFQARELKNVAFDLNLPLDQVEQLLDSACSKLLGIRQRREAPALDQKILASSNGLMISGLIWASQAFRVLGRLALAQRAERVAIRAFDFIQTNLQLSSGRLASSFQAGRAKGNAFLDDYAFLAAAAIDLSRFASVPAEVSQVYLGFAESWVQTVLTHFQDAQEPGFFFTSDDHETLIQRPKTLFDQAIPSGTSVILGCLAALADLDFQGSRTRYENELKTQLERMFPLAVKSPFSLAELLCVYLHQIRGGITVSGEGASHLCLHPFVFRQPVESSTSQKLVICHGQTCSVPMDQSPQAFQLLGELIRF